MIMGTHFKLRFHSIASTALVALLPLALGCSSTPPAQAPSGTAAAPAAAPAPTEPTAAKAEGPTKPTAADVNSVSRVPVAEATDPLTALNMAARAEYKAAMSRATDQTRPLLVVGMDNLILVRKGKDEEKAKRRPDDYHARKCVGHIALATYTSLNDADGPLEEARLARVRQFRTFIEPTRQAVASRGYSAAVVARENQIIDESLKFIDGVLARKGVSAQQVDAYAKQMSPLVMADVADAAKLELDNIHQYVQKWRKELTPAEWNDLHVVVIGAHMERGSNIAMQYFQRLLGEEGEGNRIVFAEGIWDETRARDLLGTHVLDRRLATDFFNDPMRMHRDILSDAASAYVKVLLPNEVKSTTPAKDVKSNAAAKK